MVACEHRAEVNLSVRDSSLPIRQEGGVSGVLMDEVWPRGGCAKARACLPPQKPREAPSLEIAPKESGVGSELGRKGSECCI